MSGAVADTPCPRRRHTRNRSRGRRSGSPSRKTRSTNRPMNSAGQASAEARCRDWCSVRAWPGKRSRSRGGAPTRTLRWWPGSCGRIRSSSSQAGGSYSPRRPSPPPARSSRRRRCRYGSSPWARRRSRWENSASPRLRRSCNKWSPRGCRPSCRF